MYRVYFTLLIMLSAGPAVAQSANPTLPLLATDENAFVRVIQQELSARSYYTGPLSGRLTQPTLRAIQHFCRDSGIVASCADGPLSRVGAASIVAALQPAVAVAPVPAVFPSRASQLNTPVPADWSFQDIYDGLKSEVVGGGKTADGVEYWDVRVFGHSDRTGWSNINLAPGYPSRSGQVVTLSFYAGILSPGAIDARIRLAVKRPDNLKYLGEALREGYLLAEPEARQTTFTVPPLDSDAIAIPYLQIKYVAGEDVDVVIRISPVAVQQS